MEKIQSLAPAMLEEWDRTKSPPRQTAWLHEKELKDS
jgi:glyoxylase I family protein